MKMTGKTNVVEALRAHPGAAKIFSGYGLLCLGCGGAKSETIAQAARTHGVPLATLLKELNELTEP